MANVSVSKNKGSTGNSFWGELFHVGLYKPTQGRITRQVTFAVTAAVVTLAALRIWWGGNELLRDIAAGAVLLIGWWLSYRLVNYPRFADFLIAVEAEMNKVSWPSRTELFRSSMVVIILMLSMAVLLFSFDFVWRLLFIQLGVIHQG
jgi:preprotein translocase subunit SecE